MSAFTTPLTLTGQHATLVPLDPAHHQDLVQATQDGELWRLWYTSAPSPDGMFAEIERRLALHREGAMLPFSVIHNGQQRVVGMTTFMHIDATNRRLEIGSTWYRRSVQRTALNTECKLMLLTYAFEALECIAVEFRTHVMNRQSRTGIERLGAKLDGILRSHEISRHPDAQGSVRDTCVYSIIASEWKAVRANLLHRLRQVP